MFDVQLFYVRKAYKFYHKGKWNRKLKKKLLGDFQKTLKYRLFEETAEILNKKKFLLSKFEPVQICLLQLD